MKRRKPYAVSQSQTLNKRSKKNVDEELCYDHTDHFPQPCDKGRSNCIKEQTSMECVK